MKYLGAALAVLFIVASVYSVGTAEGNRGWSVAGFEWNSAGDNHGW